MLKIIVKKILIFLFIFNFCSALALDNCSWDNREGVPCLTINKTSNTSVYNNKSVIKKIFNKQQIEAIPMVNISFPDLYFGNSEGSKEIQRVAILKLRGLTKK